MKSLGFLAGAALALVLVFAASAPAAAGEGRGAQHFDSRYAHNRAYPARGYYVGARPAGGYAVDHLGAHYWYRGGVWYGVRGSGWIVVGPPIGVFVPILPPFYTTVWFGGIPYYYANDAYYVWRDADQGYQVVDPPGEATVAAAPPAADIFIYPRNGQSEEQQGKDRYECHRWAADQTGFDPTRAAGADPGRREAYFRAMGACLEGRGYSIK